jgi:hypothetical protein
MGSESVLRPRETLALEEALRATSLLTFMLEQMEHSVARTVT